jgi:hypothetical protein
VSVTEDTSYSWDFSSKDEVVETDTSDTWYHDSYYELIVDTGAGTSIFDSDPYLQSKDIYTYTPTAGGGVITFNKETGLVTWTPNNEDVIATAIDDYNFAVIHHDGHNSQAQYDFNIVVDNVPPVITVPADTDLIEDAKVGDPVTGYQIDISSDDESEGGVTYTIEWNTNGSSDPLDAGWTDAEGEVPNIGGGTIHYDAATGIITWETTNADTTTDVNGNPITGYQFRVKADDGNTSGESGWDYFEVEVAETETSISVKDPVTHAETSTFTLTEDVLFSLGDNADPLLDDVFALDEGVGGSPVHVVDNTGRRNGDDACSVQCRPYRSEHPNVRYNGRHVKLDAEQH